MELVSDQESQPNWYGDVQARGPVDPHDPRFFFGGGGLSIDNSGLISGMNSGNMQMNPINIPFLRTKVVLLSSVLETTSIISCVAATEFVGAAPPDCRRRRRGVYERFLLAENGESIAPSPVEK